VNQTPAQYQNNAGDRHVNMPSCDNKCGAFLVSTAYSVTE